MRPFSVLIFFGLCCVCGTLGAVTNEDIRVAILQIVNVVRSTDDKLERHEYRERVLGEQLKKAMLNIDKRIKMLDPLKGTVSRLDERVAAIESILMQKDERERIQLQKTYDTVVDIQTNLRLIVDQLKNDIIQRIASHEPPAQISEPTMSKKDIERIEKEVLVRMDKVADTINKIEKEVSTIKDENNSIKDMSNKSTESLEKVKRQLDSSEQLLSRYENKLAEYNKIPEVLPQHGFKEHDEWKQNFVQALDSQRSQINEILTTINALKDRVINLPNKEDMELSQNSTLDKIEQVRYETVQIPSQSVKLLDAPLKEIQLHTVKKQQEVHQSVNQLFDITTSLTESFSSYYEKLRSEIQAVGKMEKVMMQTADNVLDTKRRVEYGVHQILADVEKQLKKNMKEINQGINDRFDTFEFSLLDEENGALTNLTSRIGDEIDQVWRQIGIMHQQMTASTDTLNKLQNQTDVYVNGSLGVMDSVKGKVGKITDRMSEVDENLNYLMGRLGLVTQEFNNIKSGLGKALDEIRASFQTVQDRIKNEGPGPHKISSNEVIDS